MTGPSWLVDSKRIAKKIKSASKRTDPINIKWITNPTKACPRCNYIIDNSDVIQDWPGLPQGVKFDPSDQELLWHLITKVGKSGVCPHPFINEFIPTVEEDDGICYTHPQKLPGVKMDGCVSHFFHRTFKAYNTGTRKRRKINTEDHGDVRWHKTGKTKPVVLDGDQRGCKKIMVLYVSAAKGGKAEKTNWVMHQYHLGTGEDEKDGEFVVSKIFYQQQLKPCERSRVEPTIENEETVSEEVETVMCTGSATPDHHDENQHLIQSSEKIFYPTDVIQVKANHDPVNENSEVNTELEKVSNQSISAHPESERQQDNPNTAAAQDSQPIEENKWWEGESQFILDSQQLAEGIAICDEFLLSQSSCASDEEKHSKPSLSDYTKIGVKDLKRDLEECQKLSQIGVKDLKRDLEECQKLSHDVNCSNIELDTPPDMRLSQIEFGSQDSFMAWAGSKLLD